MANLMAALRAADEAGDTDAAARIAQMIKTERRVQSEYDLRPDADLLGQYRKAVRSGDEAAAKHIELLTKEIYSPEAVAKDTGALESFTASMGRGFRQVGQGLGLIDEEEPTERRTFAQLEKERPYTAGAGEIVGQAAPFLIPGTGVAKFATVPGRVAAATALGAAEGAIISRGMGGGEEDVITSAGVGGAVAGGLEALFPVLGRVARKVFGKAFKRGPDAPLLTDEGLPTPALQEAMDITGTSFDDLVDESITKVNKRAGYKPEQVAREARFASQELPVTKGDITQEFGDVATEQRLISQIGDDTSAELRMLKDEQSEVFRSKINSFVDSLGVADEAGDSVKAALLGRKELLREEKNALYKEFAKAAPDAAKAPFLVDDIMSALPDKNVIDDIDILVPEQVKTLRQALARFGVAQSEESIAMLPKNISPEPLTLENFDRLRKMINGIERSDQSGAIKVLTRPIKEALDKEADFIGDALLQLDVLDSNVVKTLKDARGRVRELKTEFSPQALIGKLTDTKKDGVEQIIEGSQVYKKLMSSSAPKESLEKVVDSLGKSPGGKKALGDLQAATVLNVLDDALKYPSKKGAMNYNQFVKAFDKLGDDKLEILFKDSPKKLREFKAWRQSAFDLNPDSATTPKGSASFLADTFDKLGMISGASLVASALRTANNMAKTGMDVRKALKAQPDKLRVITQLEKEAPNLFSALGIAATIDKEER